MTKQLRIVAWNAFGVSSRRSEPITFTTEYDADIVLLSETHLDVFKSFSVASYTSYRQDRPRQARRPACGGIIVLFHRRIHHR